MARRTSRSRTAPRDGGPLAGAATTAGERPVPLRVVRERGAVEVPAAERAVADLLAALGRDPRSRTGSPA
ncbi:hypothetical protein [Geodermatophilus sp. SYSU D01036]